MATLRNTVVSQNFTTSVGGTVTAADTIYVQQDATAYNAGTTISSYDLTALIFTEGFRGSFVGAGELQVVVNQSGAGYVENRSNASRIEIRSTSATGVIKKLIQNGAGQMQLKEADCDTLIVRSGTMYVASNADVATMVCDNSGTLVVYEDASYPVTTYELNNGTAIIARDFATMNVRGSARVTLQSSTITATTLNMSGGTVLLRNATSIGTFNGYAGLLDLTQAEVLPAFTTSVHHPGLTIRLRKGQSEPSWGSLTASYGDAVREFV